MRKATVVPAALAGALTVCALAACERREGRTDQADRDAASETLMQQLDAAAADVEAELEVVIASLGPEPDRVLGVLEALGVMDAEALSALASRLPASVTTGTTGIGAQELADRLTAAGAVAQVASSVASESGREAESGADAPG